MTTTAWSALHLPASAPLPLLEGEMEVSVPRDDDEHLAFLLTATWSLRTGRHLRHVPPNELTEKELIAFWADDAGFEAHRVDTPRG